MAIGRLLIANRGEIALRIIRAAQELGIETVIAHSEDDGDSLPVRRADRAHPLEGSGPGPYLDIDQIVAAADANACDAVHPGYGFLAERAQFALRCEDAGLIFVGPRPDSLETFGDKGRARALARSLDVPVLAGTEGPTSLEDALQLLTSVDGDGAVMVKALAGGGGRGMRVVHHADELEEAFARSSSEAAAAFGDGALYVEQWLPHARHIEIQMAGDGTGEVAHLGERDCSIQRRHQKLIEAAPSPALDAMVRQTLVDASIRLARSTRLRNLATFEFLVAGPVVAFIEANPRLQVEHTVTEEVWRVDLVKAQLALAGGASLTEAGVGADSVTGPTGIALQLRINMETIGPDGTPVPTSGTISEFSVPTGPGIRVDSFATPGYRTSTRFDSLLAKLIVFDPSGDLTAVIARARRALDEFVVGGVATNISFLRRILENREFHAGRWHTRFVDEHIAELVVPAAPERAIRVGLADPLAVLDHGKRNAASAPTAAGPEGPEGTFPAEAPVQGTVVSVEVADGDVVRAGQQLAVIEAMKMEHVVTATTGGVVRGIAVEKGETVMAGAPLLYIEPGDAGAAVDDEPDVVDLDAVRPDLQAVLDRHAMGLDEQRPDAVERRRRTGQRTARQNVDELCDPGSFVEYGPLVIAAQRRRRSVEDLIEKTPADGLITGIGTVNADRYGPERSRCVVLSYDYTVLAGTQGLQNHRKKDRMFELAERWRIPLVFFTEGGGGRPGDTDGTGVAGLDVMAFHLFGRLSGLVPLVGINSGRCFAGNAAILGCCDVIIATENSSIGMGGPAMIEGGGLGVVHPDDVGPISVQVPNGVVDIAVADEAEAVAVARRYLSYFQGPLPEWDAADQRRLRSIIPENRLRIYDVRRVIETLADTGSMLELRRHFGLGMVTALARIEGRPVGLVANNPTHLAGAIDSDGADKASRFMQLCDAFDIPLVFLCDTPGIMVGTEIEKTALVRHCTRMFVVGASVTVPYMTIILRKSYGLGALAMAGGSSKAPLFTVAWPTAEFGGMGLEGAVKLGYRNELAAVEDPAERAALFDSMVMRMYEHGKALSASTYFEFDDVIDPADSRRWILRALDSVPPPPPRTGKKRPCVDTW